MSESLLIYMDLKTLLKENKNNKSQKFLKMIKEGAQKLKKPQETEEKNQLKGRLIKNKGPNYFILETSELAEYNEVEGILNGNSNDTENKVRCLVFSRISPLSLQFKDWAAFHQSELLAHRVKKNSCNLKFMGEKIIYKMDGIKSIN